MFLHTATEHYFEFLFGAVSSIKTKARGSSLEKEQQLVFKLLPRMSGIPSFVYWFIHQDGSSCFYPFAQTPVLAHFPRCQVYCALSSHVITLFFSFPWPHLILLGSPVLGFSSLLFCWINSSLVWTLGHFHISSSQPCTHSPMCLPFPAFDRGHSDEHSPATNLHASTLP